MVNELQSITAAWIPDCPFLKDHKFGENVPINSKIPMAMADGTVEDIQAWMCEDCSLMFLAENPEKKMTPWISREFELPPERKYVLARHTRGTWWDGDDQDNVNCVVVKLVYGITKQERAELNDRDPRKRMYCFGDEHGNNREGFGWETFGPDSFFGQDIECWMPIPEGKK